MKKTLFISLISLFLLNSCEKDEEAPVVNIASENKGEVITFSSSQGLTFFEPTDTFILLSGGIPPYIVESSDVGNTYINEDTLFFPIATSFTPLILKITVSDNRGYNRSQFRYITMPTTIDLDIDDINGSNVTINRIDESGMNAGTDIINNPQITYFAKEKRLQFGNINQRLIFVVDLKNGNEDPSSINYTEVTPFFFNSHFKDAPSSVKVTYGSFNIPNSIEFNLNVAVPSPSTSSFNLTTVKRYKLD